MLPEGMLRRKSTVTAPQPWIYDILELGQTLVSGAPHYPAFQIYYFKKKHYTAFFLLQVDGKRTKLPHARRFVE